jgi:hypothetical protein
VFVATTDRDEVPALTDEFPKRWRVEEFFNANQALAGIGLVHAISTSGTAR